MIIGLVLIGLAVLAWIGLQIPPASLSSPREPSAGVEYIPLPDGLPNPVVRFYREVYGEKVPVINSAVITGRGSMRIRGIRFPVSFQFTHDAGEGYRHYIEVAFFGFPVMKVNEYYLDGTGRMELPFGVIEDDPQVNQGANLGLWAEAVWYPALFVTDTRAQWKAVDQNTAILIVPYGEEEETFVARFDPQTGMLRILESMRYKGEDSAQKTLWINEVYRWEEVAGQNTVSRGGITWLDEGSPWFEFSVEDLRFNLDVAALLRSPGP